MPAVRRAGLENSRSGVCSILLSFRQPRAPIPESPLGCASSVSPDRLPHATIHGVSAVSLPSTTSASRLSSRESVQPLFGRRAIPLLPVFLLLCEVATADPGPILPPPDRPALPRPVAPRPASPDLPTLPPGTASPPLGPAPVPLPPAPRPSLTPTPSPALPPIDRPLAVPDPAPPSFAAWEEILKGLAVSLIPENYENTKDWGKQNRVFDGLNADVRNGNLRIAKRTAMVNHGLWRRYRVTLVEPERTVRVTVHDRGQVEDRQHLLISAQFEAFVDARMELWAMGVKGLNGSVHGTGTMRIDVACSYAIETGFNGALPELRLVPQIDGLNLTLVEYRARKIGPLRGDLAETVGDGGRAVLREIVNGQEEKLLKKLRTDVASRQDRLRLAPGDWLFSSGTK